MRTVWIIALFVLLACGGSVSAGVYCTDKEIPDKRFVPTIGPRVEGGAVQRIPFRNFPLLLAEMFQLGISNPDPFKVPNAEAIIKVRQPFVNRRDELQHKVDRGRASLEDTINLSAYRIWLGEAPDAIKLLTPLAVDRSRHENNFMLFANLGTAYFLTGELGRASAYLSEARDYFPPAGQDWKGISSGQLDFYREAELFQMKLLRLRGSEAGKPPAEQGQEVDDLFGVKFVGDDGSYQAGQISAAEKAKLPKNAVAIVQQLLLWLPDGSGNYDTRLYWLNGELLNAEGQVDPAYKALDLCVWGRQFRPAELQAHRQVLLDAITPKPDPPWIWVPDLPRLVAVGIGTGLVLLFLGYLQVRENRRRRLAEHH